MLIYLGFGCASYDVSFEASSDFELQDSGLMENATMAEDEGYADELSYHWQPLIDLKVDSEGNVIFEGSKAEIWFFENEELTCIEHVSNLAFVKVEAPFQQAQGWWEMSFSIDDLTSESSENDALTNCRPFEIRSFAVGMGALHSESLASWGGINWQGLEPLVLSQIQYSSYISFKEHSEIWVYGIAVKDDGWIYLRPAYKFPL